MKIPTLPMLALVTAGVLTGFLVTNHYTQAVKSRPLDPMQVTLMAPDGHATKVVLEATGIVDDVNGHHHIFCVDGREVVWAYQLYIMKRI